MVGDRVSIDVTEVIDHHGQAVVRGRYNGDFDRTKLPDEFILTNWLHRDRHPHRLVRNTLNGYRSPQALRLLSASSRSSTCSNRSPRRNQKPLTG